MGKGIAASLVPICPIQGSGFTSPQVGDSLRTRGVVTADFDTGGQKDFFLAIRYL